MVSRPICEPSVGYPRNSLRFVNQLLQFPKLVERLWILKRHSMFPLFDRILEELRLLSYE